MLFNVSFYHSECICWVYYRKFAQSRTWNYVMELWNYVMNL